MHNYCVQWPKQPMSFRAATLKKLMNVLQCWKVHFLGRLKLNFFGILVKATCAEVEEFPLGEHNTAQFINHSKKDWAKKDSAKLQGFFGLLCYQIIQFNCEERLLYTVKKKLLFMQDLDRVTEFFVWINISNFYPIKLKELVTFIYHIKYWSMLKVPMK